MYTVIENQYQSILSSIDFFSQNLNLNQIVEYGFQIYNSFDHPKASAIYTINDKKDVYQVAFSQGYDFDLPEISKNDNHGLFAVRNGFLLTDYATQRRYYEDGFIKQTSLSKIMPLIIDDQLYGFIISTDGVDREKDIVYDINFFNRFNYLMNLSLEKASRYVERNELKKEIDKHIFNLDSISQTMKMIMSQLTINGIVQLSIDVIREMTSSAVTSIALYDEVEDCIKIESYIDVVSGYKHFEKFKLKKSDIKPRLVYKLHDDLMDLEEIFEDVGLFKAFPVEYLILIINESVKGFVTIGKPLAFEKYDIDLVHRIQDITSIMNIALTNAKQFELIAFQKIQLNRQVKVLENMNRIIKTIASADSIEELSELVMTALNASLGIGKAILVSYIKGEECVIGNYNIDIDLLDNSFYEKIRTHLGENPLAFYTIDEYHSAFGETFKNYLEEINCFVLTPMYLNASSIEPFGYLLITEARDRLHESQVNMLSIMANSIAPLLNQMLVVEQYNRDYVMNPKQVLEDFLVEYTEDFNAYGIPFKVYIKRLKLLPFQTFEDMSYNGYRHVIYNGYLFVFSQSEIDTSLFDFSSEDNPTFERLASLFK